MSQREVLIKCYTGGKEQPMILSAPVLQPPVAVRKPFADMVVGNPSSFHIRYQLHAQASNPSITIYSYQAHQPTSTIHTCT